MGRFGANSRGHGRLKSQQHGAVAVVVGLTLALMIGFGGLALDLGRLFINKTELQTASDACALAAARELICDTSVAGGCPVQFLANAEAAGVSAAARNNRDMQGPAVTIAPADVRFSTVLSPNNTYLSRTDGADASSKFVMCTARSNGIVPWLMGVVGLGDANNVASSAVATLAPSQNFCLGPPIGVCTKPGSSTPNWGYVRGNWIQSDFTSANGCTGSNNPNQDDDPLCDEVMFSPGSGFKWVDFSNNPGGNYEIRAGLIGADGVCNLSIGSPTNVVQPGQNQGAKSAYNTRFGLYPPGGGPNGYTPDNAPPDHTGYAYPNKNPGSPVIAVGQSAYSDYRNRQSTGTPFRRNQYAGNAAGNPTADSDYLTKGGNRRLLAVPFVNCEANPTSIVGTACVLMLNPMDKGANGTIYLEYLGPATALGSPCAAFGTPGGPNAAGPLVPTLVQ